MSDEPTVGADYIGPYQVLRPLGEGGMGAVFLGRDPALGREVAIKVMRDPRDVSDEARRRFQAEARTAAQLQHKNIVTVFSVGEYERKPYIAMEYLRGETLGQMIRRKAQLSLGMKLRFIDELCEGLRHAHDRGVVHRDIKPANVIVSKPDGIVKILDFGIARINEGAGTQTGTVLGTVNYMSPEQIKGQRVDHRSDIFAVGAVFYELLTYEMAFPGRTYSAAVSQVLTEEPVPLEQVIPSIDPGVIRIVTTALQKELSARYQDIERLRRELTQLRARYDAGENPVSTIVLHSPEPAAESIEPDLDDPERLRQQELRRHLEAAEASFAAADYGAAIESAVRALVLDKENVRAKQIYAQARERRATVWVADARAKLERGDLAGAAALIENALKAAPQLTEAIELQRRVGLARAEQLEEQARAERLRHLMTAARADFAAERYAEALEAANDALALDAGSPEAAELQRVALDGLERKRKWEHDRRARAAVDAADTEFSAGQIAEAIDGLEAFNPPHPLVEGTLTRLRAEAAAIESRRAERAARERRLEAERLEREARFDTEIGAATAALGSGRFDDALTRIEAARQIYPGATALDALSEQARAGKAAAAAAEQMAREAGAKLDQAQSLVEQNELEAARQLLDDVRALNVLPERERQLRRDWQRRSDEALASALTPDAVDIQSLLRDAEERARRVRQESIAEKNREAAAALAQAKSQDAAQAVDEVLQLEPANAEALALQRRVVARRDEERARRRELALARLAEAREAAARGQFEVALEHVNAAESEDPSSEELERVRREIRRAAAAAEAAEQLQAQVAERLGLAGKALDEHDFSAALSFVEIALRLDASSTTASEMRRRIVEAREAAIADKLQAARTALARGDFRGASGLVRDAQEIDDENADAATLAELIRARAERRAEDERQERQRVIDEAMAVARASLEASSFAEAFSAVRRVERIDPDAAGLAELRSEIRSAQAKAEVAEQLRQQVAEYLRPAEAALDRLEFRVADGFVNVALGLDPSSDAAKSLRARIGDSEREYVRRKLNDARALLQRDDFGGAARVAQEAAQVDTAGTSAALLEEVRTRRHAAMEASFAAARGALERNDFEAALAAIDRAEQLEPYARGLSELRAEVGEAQARRETALKVAEHLDAAEAALSRQDYAAAERFVDVALVLAPDNTAASAAQRRIVEARSGRVQTKLAEAQARLEHDDFAGALRLAQEAIQIDPESTPAATLRDQIQHRREQAIDEAVAAARAALDAENVNDAAAAIARAQQFDPYAPRVADLRAELRATQNRAEIRLRVAEHLQVAGAALARRDYGAAERALNLALGVDAASVDATAMRQRVADTKQADVAGRLANARTQLQQEDFAGAARIVQEAQQIDESNVAAASLAKEIAEHQQQSFADACAAARAAIERGQFDGAREALDRAARIQPYSPQVTELRRELRAAEQKAATARNVDEQLRLAEAALKGADYAAAEQYVTTALSLDAASADASALRTRIGGARREQARQRLAAARSLLDAGSFAAASEQAREAHRIDRQDTQAAALLKEIQARKERTIEDLLAAARTALEQSLPDAALEKLKAAQAIEPDAPGLAELQGLVRSAKAEEKGAEAVRRDVLKRIEDGERALKRRDFKAASQCAEAALQLDPSNAQALDLRERVNTAAGQVPWYRKSFAGPIAAAAVIAVALLIGRESLPDQTQPALPAAPTTAGRMGLVRPLPVPPETGIVIPEPEQKPPGPQAPPPGPAMGTLFIDALPWAEVVSIVDAKGTGQPIRDRQTPLSLSLPEGEYTVVLKPPAGAERSVKMRVPAGGRAAELVPLAPPKDADSYFKKLGFEVR